MGYEDIRKLQLLLRNVVNILLIMANDDGYRWLMMVSNNDWLVVSTYPSEQCESQWEGWHPIYEMEHKKCLKPPTSTDLNSN